MDNAAVSSCPGESFCLRLQVSSPPPLPSVRRKWKTSSSGAKGLTQKTIFKKEKQKRKNIHLDTGKKIKDNCRDLSTYMCMYIYFCIKIIYNFRTIYIIIGLPCSSNGKESACNAGDLLLDPWVRRIFWRRQWQSTPVLLLVESQTEKPGGLQFVGSQRVGHDWATNTIY